MKQPTITRTRRGGRHSPRTTPARTTPAGKILASPSGRCRRRAFPPEEPGPGRCHHPSPTRDPGPGRCRRHRFPLLEPGRGPRSRPSVTRPVHRRERARQELGHQVSRRALRRPEVRRLEVRRPALCRRAPRLAAPRPGKHRDAEPRAGGRQAGPGTRAVRRLPLARATCRRPMRRGVPHSRRRPVTRRRRGSRNLRTCRPPGTLKPCRSRRRRIPPPYYPYHGRSRSLSRAWRDQAR